MTFEEFICQVELDLERYAAQGGVAATENMLLCQARNGDHAFTQVCASIVLGKLSEGTEINPADNAFIIWALHRIRLDPEVSRVISGASKRRGAPKDGWAGWSVAVEVTRAITEHGAVSLEDAWAITAERSSLSESAVKGHWIRWKDNLRLGLAPEETLEGVLREAIARNKAARR